MIYTGPGGTPRGRSVQVRGGSSGGSGSGFVPIERAQQVARTLISRG